MTKTGKSGKIWLLLSETDILIQQNILRKKIMEKNKNRTIIVLTDNNHNDHTASDSLVQNILLIAQNGTLFWMIHNYT